MGFHTFDVEVALLKKLVFALLVVYYAALLAGCSGSNIVSPGVALVNTQFITVNGPAQMTAGQTVQFTATSNNFDRSNTDVTNVVLWASDNPAVATVDASGVVRALSGGTATISATLNGVTGSLQVAVSQTQVVTITPQDRFVQVGSTFQLGATATDNFGAVTDVTGTAVWTSSAPGVATVGATGLVTANAVGSTTITATSGGVSDTATIDVFQVVVREGVGATPAALTPIVTAFRADLGDPLNPNVAGSFPAGRREINWDGTPAQFTFPPNALPANFFNVNSPRGVVFATNGTNVLVSADNFASVNPTYAGQFQFFSPVRTFAPQGGTVTFVDFFVPGSTTPAETSGFGAVFSDVDLTTSSNIVYTFPNGQTFQRAVPALAQGLSFLGVTFNGVDVRRVTITSGNTALGPNDGGTTDVVIMDDFLYGEPQAITP